MGEKKCSGRQDERKCCQIRINNDYAQEIYNTQMFRIKKIDVDKFTTLNLDNGTVRTVSKKCLDENFDAAFCIIRRKVGLSLANTI